MEQFVFNGGGRGIFSFKGDFQWRKIAWFMEKLKKKYMIMRRAWFIWVLIVE